MPSFLEVLDLRDYIGDQDEGHEPGLQSAVNAACAAIESPIVTNRRFDKDTEASARRFRPRTATKVRIHDAAEVDTVKVDTADNGTFDLVWASTEWETLPLDGIGTNGVAGWAAEAVDAVGSRTFPCGGRRPRVEVMATWGWPAVPAEIHQAALQLAHRLFELRGAGLGIATSDEIVGAVRVARQIAGWSDLVGPYAAYGARGVLVA